MMQNIKHTASIIISQWSLKERKREAIIVCLKHQLIIIIKEHPECLKSNVSRQMEFLLKDIQYKKETKIEFLCLQLLNADLCWQRPGLHEILRVNCF